MDVQISLIKEFPKYLLIIDNKNLSLLSLPATFSLYLLRVANKNWDF